MLHKMKDKHNLIRNPEAKRSYGRPQNKIMSDDVALIKLISQSAKPQDFFETIMNFLVSYKWEFIGLLHYWQCLRKTSRH
jgi:hypothetical protein